jgi:hypothetical protein
LEGGIEVDLSAASVRILKFDSVVKAVDKLPLDCGGSIPFEFRVAVGDERENTLEFLA